jgi:hydroxymethylpyrimidine pyrophosphatase-like HAD family hydrolase
VRYHALCTDYDGTLACAGHVAEETVRALEELRQTGRKLVLVTGRELPDLLRVYPHPELFDRIVAENGGLLYRPATREEVPLAEPPPPAFVEALRRRGVSPLSAGKVIVATWEPHQNRVLETIRELGLELQIAFNKGAVMVLPAGVNKATGLVRALEELALSPRNAVGIGDAENDHAFLASCECAVAVADALPEIKERADLVTAAACSGGVAELARRLASDDLRDVTPAISRRAAPESRQ